jgi:hypothetical protein
MGVHIVSMARRDKEADMAQDILPQVKEHANKLRNAEILPYQDLLAGDLVESTLAEEEFKFRVRGYTLSATGSEGTTISVRWGPPVTPM